MAIIISSVTPKLYRLSIPGWFALAYSAIPAAAVGNMMRRIRVLNITIPMLESHLSALENSCFLLGQKTSQRATYRQDC